eukprot:m.107724 g.107724  ORF g.107724 m.107724 type:complete len:51 (+) comp12698_c0_seq5:779-931(+)
MRVLKRTKQNKAKTNRNENIQQSNNNDKKRECKPPPVVVNLSLIDPHCFS